jgi:D-3-phosphoglycerate dehydrogenase
MINKDTIAQMKDGVVLLNFSRDLLINEDDLAEALELGKVAKYVTDFPTPKVMKMKNVIAFPHLGATTEESEDNCAKMAAQELNEYLEYGNIRNSVNFPNCELPPMGHYRLSLIHSNVANMVGQMTSILAEENINISHMINKSKGAYAYTMFDLDAEPTAGALDRLKGIEGMIKVGEAIQTLRRTLTPDGTEFCRDGFHLSYDYGRYAGAYVWAKFFGTEITDFVPEGADPNRIAEIRRVIDTL